MKRILLISFLFLSAQGLAGCTAAIVSACKTLATGVNECIEYLSRELNPAIKEQINRILAGLGKSDAEAIARLLKKNSKPTAADILAVTTQVNDTQASQIASLLNTPAGGGGKSASPQTTGQVINAGLNQ